MQPPFIPFELETYQPGQLATIDPNTCIGCTKCLPVCPTDAILGSGKQLHLVLRDDCTGCGQCIPACPVDCIQLIADPRSMDLKQQQEQITRLSTLGMQRLTRWQQATQTKLTTKTIDPQKQEFLAEIAAARARVHAKKHHQI